VPNAAIQHGSAGTFVYLITPDKDATKVVVQPVKLGTVDGDNVAVLDGLKPKNQVVISGIDKLRDNAKVKISSPDGKAGKEGRQGGKRGKGDGSRHQANSSTSQASTSAGQ
jgi:multidrug efflux system membrane fusion protein